MTIFQLIMLAAAAFFAYQVYTHIQGLDEDAEPAYMDEPDEIEVAEVVPAYEERIAEADAAYMKDDIAKAKELLELVVKDFPVQAEGMNKLAFILAKENDNEAALLYYRASLRIVEDDDMTHNAIARLLVKMNHNDEAEEHYKAAISIDDNDETTWFNYSELMLVYGRSDEARMMLEKALAIAPDFEEAQALLKKIS